MDGATVGDGGRGAVATGCRRHGVVAIDWAHNQSNLSYTEDSDEQVYGEERG